MQARFSRRQRLYDGWVAVGQDIPLTPQNGHCCWDPMQAHLISLEKTSFVCACAAGVFMACECVHLRVTWASARRAEPPCHCSHRQEDSVEVRSLSQELASFFPSRSYLHAGFRLQFIHPVLLHRLLDFQKLMGISHVLMVSFPFPHYYEIVPSIFLCHFFLWSLQMDMRDEWESSGSHLKPVCGVLF